MRTDMTRTNIIDTCRRAFIDEMKPNVIEETREDYIGTDRGTLVVGKGTGEYRTDPDFMGTTAEVNMESNGVKYDIFIDVDVFGDLEGVYLYADGVGKNCPNVAKMILQAMPDVQAVGEALKTQVGGGNSVKQRQHGSFGAAACL